jgi:cyclic pyranopterin phosphate synthase
MVVKRGIERRPGGRHGRHFRGSGHVVRFIEYMDVGSTNGWRMDDVVPSAEVVRRIGECFPLEPLDATTPARSRSAGATRDGAGEIGMISR